MTAYKVTIDSKAHAKIRYWMNKAGNMEVSGLGNVIYDKKTKRFEVTDVWLQRQTNTGSNTDIHADAMSELMVMHEQLKQTGAIEAGDLRFWWHSHHNMGVFWSSTDEKAMAELSEHGWFLSTVFNHKDEVLTSWQMQRPFLARTDNIETDINPTSFDADALRIINDLHDKYGYSFDTLYYTPTEQDEKEWDQEYDKMVTVKTLVPSKWTGNGYSNWNSYGYEPDVAPLLSTPAVNDSRTKTLANAYEQAIITLQSSTPMSKEHDVASLICDITYENLGEHQLAKAIDEYYLFNSDLTAAEVKRIVTQYYPQYPGVINKTLWSK